MERAISISLVLICLCSLGAEANVENEALIRLRVYSEPEVWRLSRTVSLELWDRDILRNPIRASASYVYDPVNDILYSSMLFIAEYMFDGVLYREDVGSWFRTYGHHGFGDGPEFFNPRSIDVFTKQGYSAFWTYYDVFVADWWNDRIKRFNCNWYTREMIDVGPITGFGIARPKDLDYNNNGDFDDETDDYLVILNGNWGIIGYDLRYDEIYFEYGGLGSPVQPFDDPTAIACGRSWIDIGNPYFQSYANTEEIYVADAGNERIVKLWGSHHYVCLDSYWDDPRAAFMVDLEVDNFGHVWAVLSTGEILKLTSDLLYLTSFGSEGFGENQFFEPKCIANVGGFLGVGDMIVTEDWGDSSGVQHYFIGTDIEALDVTMVEDSSGCEACISFKLVDFGFLSVKIFDESGDLVKNLSPGERVESGWNYFWWDGKDTGEDDVPAGNYRVEVADTSAYVWLHNFEPVNVAVEEQWFYLCEVGINVSSTTPGQNQMDMPDSCDIQVVYNVPLGEGTISESSFIVNGQISGPHTGQISYDIGTGTITFDPDADFAPGEEVTVTLTAAIESYFGTPMENSYTWSFTVESEEAAAIYPLPDTCGVDGSTKSCIAADFNDDGYADIAAGCNDSGSCNVSVLMGNGDGTFSSAVSYPVGNCPYRYALTASDLNGDGCIDIATANAGSHDVTILMNLGDGTFAASVCYPVGGICPRSIFAADLDGDGDNDLLTENWNSSNVSILFNDGNGAFSVDSVYSMYGAGHSAIAADLDGDGDLDIAATDRWYGTVSVFPNRGDGTFEPYFVYPIGNGASSLAAADLDGDGDLDLATANMVQASTRLDLELDEMSDEPDSSVSVIFNDGDWSFSSPVEYQVGTKPTRVRAADLDGDGDMDLVSSNFDSYDVSILLNNGDSTFLSQRRYPIGDYPREVFAADFDSDGDLDLVAPNPEWTVSVILNHECGKPGDADGSGALDIDDNVRLIQFIFSSGPSPKPYPIMSGDADCSCEVSIDDVVYLSNHIFLGGPPPCFCETWIDGEGDPSAPGGCGELQ